MCSEIRSSSVCAVARSASTHARSFIRRSDIPPNLSLPAELEFAAMAHPPAARSPYVRYAVLAVLFTIALVYQTRVTGVSIAEMVNGQSMSRLPFDPDLPELIVTGELPAESAAAGVHVGDRITHVNGSRVEGSDDLFPPIFSAAPGQIVRLGIAPGA